MRLIDADALIEKMPTVMDMQELYLPIHFKEWLIDEAPTIDAVEVVRCKDCDNYAGYGMYCAWDVLTGDMGYCHHARPKDGTDITDGERRTDEQTD